MTVTHEHPKYGKLELVADADSLVQSQVEAYVNAYRALDGKYEANGKLVRAAATAGWILEPMLTADEVANRTAKWVAWAGKIIDRLYAEATTPDPKA